MKRLVSMAFVGLLAISCGGYVGCQREPEPAPQTDADVETDLGAQEDMAPPPGVETTRQ